jgi:membrane protein
MIDELLDIDWKLFLKNIYRKSIKIDIFVNAMGLVYTTLLSIIPLLIFSFYIITLFNFFGEMESIINFIKGVILNNLATGTGQTLITYLEGYVNNININQLGVISFFSLVIVIILMLARVEKTFNKIWGVEEHRDFFKRFVAFWTFITLGTFIITLSLSLVISLTSSYLSKDLTTLAFANTFIFRFISITFPFLIFILGYYLIPNTEVEPLAAIIGGLISGGLFDLAKILYSVYTNNVVTYSQIYGPLSVIPLFLIWLYLIWVISLLGSVISYVFQHRHRLNYFEDDREINMEMTGLVSIAILIAIYKEFIKRSAMGITFEELSDRINLPANIIDDSLKKLIKNNLVSKTKENRYLLLTDLSDISLWEVYQSQVFDQLKDVKDIFRDKEMWQACSFLEEGLEQNLKGLTIIDLLD